MSIIFQLIFEIIVETAVDSSGWIVAIATPLFSGVLGAAITAFLAYKKSKGDDISNFRKDLMNSLANANLRIDELEKENTRLNSTETSIRAQMALMRIEHEIVMRLLPAEQAAQIRKDALSAWITTNSEQKEKG